jgi:hypothetical protein
MELTPRFYLCLLCHEQVTICRHCDRGNIYCGWACAQKARIKSLHLAGSRYQSTFKGKCHHAARQARYRIGLLKKVTHQGSLNPPQNDSINLPEKSPNEIEKRQVGVASTCSFCNKPVSEWIRSNFLRKRDHKKLVLAQICPQGP